MGSSVMEELLAQSQFENLQEGAIIPGTVTEIRENEVIVDIGGKSEGILPANEFPDVGELSIGSEIEVFLDKLEDRGLLRRRPSEDDRREKMAELTAEGRAKIEDAFPEHASLIDDLMADLDLEEKRQAASMLRRLERFVNEYDEPGVAGPPRRSRSRPRCRPAR